MVSKSNRIFSIVLLDAVIVGMSSVLTATSSGEGVSGTALANSATSNFLETSLSFSQVYNLLKKYALGLEQISNLDSMKLSAFQYAFNKLEYRWRVDNLLRKSKRAEKKINYEKSIIRKLMQV